MSQADTDKRLLQAVRARLDVDEIVEQIIRWSTEQPVVLMGVDVGEEFVPGLSSMLDNIENVYFASHYPDDAERVLVADLAVIPATGMREQNIRKLGLPDDVAIDYRQPLHEKVASIVIEETPKLIKPDLKENRQVKISNIILSGLNNGDSLRQMLESYKRFTPSSPDLETIVVINGSSDDSAATPFTVLGPDYQLKVVQVVNNVGIAGGFNEGMRIADGDHVCLLQDDILFSQHDWHRELAYYLDEYPLMGQIGGFRGGLYFKKQQETPIDSPYYSIGNPVIGECQWGRLSTELVKVDAVLCMCAMHRRSLGFYDEQFLPNGMEDIAFSFRIRKLGYEVWVLDSGITHGLNSATRGSQVSGPRSRRGLKTRFLSRTREAAKISQGPISAHRRLSRPFHCSYFVSLYGDMLRDLPQDTSGDELNIDNLGGYLEAIPRSFARKTGPIA